MRSRSVEIGERYRLLYHAGNGAIVLRTFDEKGAQTASEIVVRFTYADDALTEALFDATLAVVRVKLLAC
jgi:hypothetical protein